MNAVLTNITKKVGKVRQVTGEKLHIYIFLSSSLNFSDLLGNGATTHVKRFSVSHMRDFLSDVICFFPKQLRQS